MLPTPSTSHLISSKIYPPSEDSYLLLDTLSNPQETNFFASRFLPFSATPLILELGVGSGVVIAFLTAHACHIFKREDVLTLGGDINLTACHGAGETVLLTRKDQDASKVVGRWLGAVCADLATAVKPRCVDILIFNPPYVPTESLPSLPEGGLGEEGTMLELAWAGGEAGMEVTNRLLGDLDLVLSERGVAYLLLCKGNQPETVKRGLQKHGWKAEIVGSSGKTAGWERLVVMRIWRP